MHLFQGKVQLLNITLPDWYSRIRWIACCYRPQGKVMFSQVSVCPQSASWILAHCLTLLQRGRYASYWNAFLYLIAFVAVFWIHFNSPLFFQGVPNDGHFKTLDDIVTTCTSLIFTCSAKHAVFNFPGYDNYAFTPNMPLSLTGHPPRNKVDLR